MIEQGIYDIEEISLIMEKEKKENLQKYKEILKIVRNSSDILDTQQKLEDYADFLRKEKKCDLVVCLSHLGYDYGVHEQEKMTDKKVATQTSGIDLIIGGHTHTFLPEPQVFQNKNGKNVLVNQVGWAGLLLGRIDFYFDRNKKISGISWNNQRIDDSIMA